MALEADGRYYFKIHDQGSGLKFKIHIFQTDHDGSQIGAITKIMVGCAKSYDRVAEIHSMLKDEVLCVFQYPDLKLGLKRLVRITDARVVDDGVIRLFCEFSEDDLRAENLIK